MGNAESEVAGLANISDRITGKVTERELGAHKGAECKLCRPLVRYVTINNIKSLDIFVSKYFNGFDAIQTLILQGSFELDEDDLCIFTGITLQPGPNPTRVILNSSKISTDDWNQCANTL